MQKWLGPTLKEFATTERLSDCRFIIEAADGSKKSFKCHKFIFSCASNVFERMFYGDFLESKTNEIVLKNVRADIFSKFREYLYNYDINVLHKYNVITLIDLVQFGQQYLVTSITEECIGILCHRTIYADMVVLIQLYQFGNDILREDLVQEAVKNITKYPDSMNHFGIYELSSDVFFKYMKMTEYKLREVVRFKMIETYLKLNGFVLSKVISKLSNNFEQLDLQTEDVNEEDKDLELQNQVNDSLSDDHVKTETKSNVSNEDDNETIQNHQLENEKLSYTKRLIELVNYGQMTSKEFYNGPGKSEFFDLQYKFDMLYHISQYNI